MAREAWAVLFVKYWRIIKLTLSVFVTPTRKNSGPVFAGIM
jgi:hypothetical protein